MANRHTLHISETEKFEKWLSANGWEILPLSNNPFEVIRAVKRHERFLVIYRKARAKEHLSYADRDADIIGQFLKERKHWKNECRRFIGRGAAAEGSGAAEWLQEESRSGSVF